MEKNNSDFNLRYGRQLAIPEIGKEGQLKLLNSKVLVIGCGALGSMVAMQLAGAGVGTIGIADYDSVDISNLQRQFFFKMKDAGKQKVEILSDSIKNLNPDILVEEYGNMITHKNAEVIFNQYDFIVDATDNPDSKKMIGEVSFKVCRPCCIGGVREFSGQVMTFLPNDSRFENYFGSSPASGVLPCSLGGVIGPAAALCASIQAAEVIKYITGTGKTLSGNLLLFNLLTNTYKNISL